jgi:hypothetical protein
LRDGRGGQHYAGGGDQRGHAIFADHDVFLSNRSKSSEPLVDLVRFPRAKVPTVARSSRRRPARFTKKGIISSAIGDCRRAAPRISRSAPGAELVRRDPPQQGINSEFSGIERSTAKIRLENIYDFKYLLGGRREIPCATEQGINSTTSGK